MKVSLSEDGRTVVFTLAWYQVPFALKSRLEVPAGKIKSVQVMAREDVGFGPVLRAPGTYVPGLIKYGSYGRKPNREFWVVTRNDPVLVVDIEDWDYTRIVGGTADPANDAGTVQLARR